MYLFWVSRWCQQPCQSKKRSLQESEYYILCRGHFHIEGHSVPSSRWDLRVLVHICAEVTFFLHWRPFRPSQTTKQECLSPFPRDWSRGRNILYQYCSTSTTKIESYSTVLLNLIILPAGHFNDYITGTTLTIKQQARMDSYILFFSYMLCFEGHGSWVSLLPGKLLVTMGWFMISRLPVRVCPLWKLGYYSWVVNLWSWY